MPESIPNHQRRPASDHGRARGERLGLDDGPGDTDLLTGQPAIGPAAASSERRADRA